MYKFTNKEDMMKFVDAFTAANADKPCTIPFGEVVDGMKKYYEVMGMTIDLVNLIREEAELKKHHRAYLHVREELEDTADEAMERIVELLRNGSAPHVCKPESFPFSDADEDEEAVTISKEKYDCMVDGLLTMAELIDMVADMRTRDMEAIRVFAKFVPSFAAYEHNRLRFYREAAKEAEEIIDRWADDLDDEDEPDEYFSD